VNSATAQPLLAGLAALLCLAGCHEPERPAPIRPVRSVVIQAQNVGDPIVLTGQLRARDEVSLSFRISGKLVQRLVGVGDTVKAGQVVAVLDSENEKNARLAYQADCLAAQAVLEQAEASEKRLARLLEEKAVARAEYEAALRQLKTAQAQVHASQARLQTADDQLGYTELKAEADGVITEKGAEPGEVVRAGQMILLLARQDGRDAVFDMPAQVIRAGLSSGHRVEVWLADNPAIRASGDIREVAPQADASTRTYPVKVGLHDAPAGMFLGSTVVGRILLRADMHIQIPASALCMAQGQPSVWRIDPKDQTVRACPVAIAGYAQDAVIVSGGLEPGDRIVTAGAHEIHDGQPVRLLEDFR